jgi:hypothetical protein
MRTKRSHTACNTQLVERGYHLRELNRVITAGEAFKDGRKNVVVRNRMDVGEHVVSISKLDSQFSTHFQYLNFTARPSFLRSVSTYTYGTVIPHRI